MSTSEVIQVAQKDAKTAEELLRSMLGVMYVALASQNSDGHGVRKKPKIGGEKC